MAISIISREEPNYQYDLFSAFNSDNAEMAAKKSGFLDINKTSGSQDIIGIIEEELDKYGLLSSLFVEFNLVGSLLEPDNPDKLNSLVYIRQENGSNFSQNIKKYSDSIIKEFANKRKYTLFFHPDVFIDPKNPQVCYSIIDKRVNVQFESKEEEADYYKEVYGDINRFLGKATFPRDYYTILSKASEIREKNIDVNKELSDFHKYYHYLIVMIVLVCT